MFILQDNERLYLSSWNYNAALITSELANIVKDNGGRVKPTRTAIISNRTITEMENKYRSDIERLEKLEPNEKRNAYIEKLKNASSELNKINNDPVAVTHLGGIVFTLNNTFYHYWVDDNPFFEFYYVKTPIVNGKYSKDTCCEEDKKEWLYDCFFKYGCSKEDIREGANLIFNMLVKANNSIIRRDSKKQRVPNIYDGGYHYETVYNPERICKIDF